MLQAFSDWLSTTPVSIAIATTTWVIPAAQTIHIAAIAVVMSSIVMIDLRLLGVMGRSQPVSDVGRRFLPWIWTAVVVLLASAIPLILAEPGRELLSKVFWLKMSMLACALVLTAIMQKWFLATPTSAEQHRSIAGLCAIVSLVLWTAIVSAGRWIAYIQHG